MNPRPKILVVDGDAAIIALLGAYLVRFGLQVHAAANSAQMQQQLSLHAIDLVVLDPTLPGADGMALACALRAASRIPIIMLTARCSPADRVIGLEMGADDFMGKPFEPRELVARIQSVLRRVGEPRAEASGHLGAGVVRFGGWALQRDERRLTSPSGVAVPLSDAEFRLLSTFLKTPRRVVSREQLMVQARGRIMDGLDRSIDLLVSRLRLKLQGGAGTAELIKTVRGAGYLFDAQPVNGPAWGY